MAIKSVDPKEKFSLKSVRAAPDDMRHNKRKVELNSLARQVAEQFAADAVSPNIIITAVRLIEFFAITAISMIIYLFYVYPFSGLTLGYYVTASLLGGVLTSGAAQALDSYQIHTFRSFISQSSKVVAAFIFAVTALAILGFMTKLSVEFSRAWLSLWFVIGVTFLITFRVLVWHWVRKLAGDGRLERRAVIVGGGKNAEDLIRSLEAQSDSDIRICGIFDDRAGTRSPPIVAGYPKLGTVPELVEFARVARIDMLIVSLPLSAENRLLQMMKKLWVLPVDIRLSAHTYRLRFRPRSYSYEGSVPLLDVFDKPLADWDAFMKRAFDLVMSVIALVVLAPVMVATMAAIRIESAGPVIFRQRRYGFNNEEIEVLKFRSMFHEFADPTAKFVVTRNDPRVTAVGRFIRKSSIDELPQLINVIRGELSLVGPRPHAVNAHTSNRLWDEVVDGYFARHKVKPGVTGWAQIKGWRGEVDSEDKIKNRVAHDLYYIENWSLMFDFYILAITPFQLFNTKNAY